MTHFTYHYYSALFMIVGLILVVYVGVEALSLQWLFGVIIPYLAVIIFFYGMLSRVLRWARCPVPFRIPTTCGQQKTLSWIKPNNLETPYNTSGVIVRMLLEVLTFRSLFRNTKMEYREGPNIIYWSQKWLWLGAIAFHYAFLTTLVRHLRFFAEPVPSFVNLIEGVDGFLHEITIPTLQISGVVLLVAVTYLLLRRMFIPHLRYISLATADYFPLFVIIGIAFTGILMRYFFKVDVTAIKELTMGLVSLHPKVPEGIGALFYIHLFLVSVLFAYFPYSKLTHMVGIFLSPTRNMANNNRQVRHINPWNYDVDKHPYEEYEDEFREKMKGIGLPVEKE
jgi:nitrate reductase gamma subunit